MAYAMGLISLQTPIRVRIERTFEGVTEKRIIDCTLGKLIFNEALPQDMGFKPRNCLDDMFVLEVDGLVGKKKLAEIVDMCFTSQGEHKCAIVLDKIKALGYKYATRSAVTVSVADIKVPRSSKEDAGRGRREGPPDQQLLPPRPDERGRALPQRHRGLDQTAPPTCATRSCPTWKSSTPSA